MRYSETEKRQDLFVFESVDDMTKYLLPEKFEPATKSFAGEDIPTWEKLKQRLERPWAEGMYLLDQFIERLRKVEMPELKSHKRRTCFDEMEGDEIDYDRLRSGQSYWRSATRELHTGPQEVTILTDTSTNCSVDSEDILWRGAAALALTHVLEEKGYKVELWAVDGTANLYTDDPSKQVLIGCCLKRPQDPIDTGTLINALSGWFYRSQMFMLFRTVTAKLNHGLDYGLGKAKPPTEVDLDNFSRDELRIYSSGVFSFDAAANLIEAELARVGAR